MRPSLQQIPLKGKNEIEDIRTKIGSVTSRPSRWRILKVRSWSVISDAEYEIDTSKKDGDGSQRVGKSTAVRSRQHGMVAPHAESRTSARALGGAG